MSMHLCVLQYKGTPFVRDSLVIDLGPSVGPTTTRSGKSLSLGGIYTHFTDHRMVVVLSLGFSDTNYALSNERLVDDGIASLRGPPSGDNLWAVSRRMGLMVTPFRSSLRLGNLARRLRGDGMAGDKIFSARHTIMPAFSGGPNSIGAA
jgi:hypothetical protein